MALTPEDLAILTLMATVVSAFITIVGHLWVRPQELQAELRADAVRKTYDDLAALTTDARDLWNKIAEMEASRKPGDDLAPIVKILLPKVEKVAEDWVEMKKALIALGYQFPKHGLAPALDRLEYHVSKLVLLAKADSLLLALGQTGAASGFKMISIMNYQNLTEVVAEIGTALPYLNRPWKWKFMAPTGRPLILSKEDFDNQPAAIWARDRKPKAPWGVRQPTAGAPQGKSSALLEDRTDGGKNGGDPRASQQSASKRGRASRARDVEDPSADPPKD